MLEDVRKNNHLYFYPTDLGFGSPANKSNKHPLLEPTKEKADGHNLVANDVFRIVHDYFGHAKEGNSFGPKGEEAAWQNHMPMYSPEAQKALTTETRGQNSWVNFGPKGQENRQNPQNTQYAEQKAGILPPEAMATDEQKFADGGDVSMPDPAQVDVAETQPTEKSLTGQPADTAQQVPDQSGVDVATPSQDQKVPDQSSVEASMPHPDNVEVDEQPSGFGSTGQQAITALEGIGQGLAGPLSTLAETKLLGVKPEDIAARAAANPWTHGIAEGAAIAGSMLYGVGEAGLIAKGASKIVPKSIPMLGEVFG